MQLIIGNTYPVKEQLKALGATWNKGAQGWNIPNENADRAREIVAAAGPSSYVPRQRGGYGSVYTRFASGAEVFRNKRGRCIDAPCCGCCS